MTLSLLLFVGISATVAWFINYGTNKIEGTEVSVSTGNVMELSTDGITYSSSLKKNDFSQNGLIMTDITGDGKTFLRPVLSESLEQQGDSEYQITIATPDENQTWAEVKSTADCPDSNYEEASYISFPLYFRSNAEMDIYLSKDSKIEPTNPNGNWSLYSTNTEELKFSKDWIAAASRISFVDEDETGEKKVKMIWAPLPNVELSYVPNGEYPGFRLNSNGTSEQTYTYRYEPNNGSGYKTFTYETSMIDTNDAAVLKEAAPFYTKIQTNSSEIYPKEVPLTRLTKDEESGAYIGNVTVNLWIEGCDREARRALAGGEIKFSLVFLGFETSAQVHE